MRAVSPQLAIHSVVCALVTTVSPAKTAEPFEMPKEPCTQWIYIWALPRLNDMKNVDDASVAIISETTFLLLTLAVSLVYTVSQTTNFTAITR